MNFNDLKTNQRELKVFIRGYKASIALHQGDSLNISEYLGSKVLEMEKGDVPYLYIEVLP